MTDWYSKRGKLIVDGDHYTYWNSDALIYVRDGGDYVASAAGPHFLDLGIMGSCRRSCNDCYIQSKRTNRNMPLETADRIVYDLRNTLCQVSFGGAGDPLDYERFDYLPEMGRVASLGEFVPSVKYEEDIDAALASWDVHYEPVENIARCATINPRGLAFTPEQVKSLARFRAVGLSCGSASGNVHDGGLKDIARLLRQADDLWMEYRYSYPEFILHFIVDSGANDLRKFVHLLSYESVKGVLLLARKASERRPWPGGPFSSREQQVEFWGSVAAVYEVLRKPVAVDSCLAPLVDPDTFPHFRPEAMHPCDAGRFSAYIHADGSMCQCSCSTAMVERGSYEAAWRQAMQSPQDCSGLLPSSGTDIVRKEWSNPPVVIQHGPMTNSSSASYFVIAPKAVPLKIEVLDFAGRARLAREDDASANDRFNWYQNNKRLVKLTLGEWASWCAIMVAQCHESPAESLRMKKRLDLLTKRIVAGESVFYLVADRDDGDTEPVHYDRKDVSGDECVTLIKAGEEH